MCSPERSSRPDVSCKKDVLTNFLQKQPSRGVLRKRCSENMQQIYRKPMPKCDFNEFALQLYWNHTSAWVSFCKFAVYSIYRTPFSTTPLCGYFCSENPEKSICQSLFFNKVAGIRDSDTRVFLWNLRKFRGRSFSRTPLKVASERALFIYFRFFFHIDLINLFRTSNFVCNIRSLWGWNKSFAKVWLGSYLKLIIRNIIYFWDWDKFTVQNYVRLVWWMLSI